MRELEARVAIVTGAARGVGLVIAERLVAAGARVVLADVLEDEGQAAANKLGAAARFALLDVTREADWARVVDETLAADQQIDVLVNNAGVLHMGSLENTAPADFQRIMNVNAFGPFLGTRAVLSAMKAQQAGSIVHVSSIDGMLGMNGVTAYATSKWALRGLAKASALELGRDGIRVNSVCPAGGNPVMFGPWFEKMDGFRDQVEFYTNNRGIPGTMPLEAIANAVLYLTSDASLHVTGIDLPVDGGATAGRYIDGFNTL